MGLKPPGMLLILSSPSGGGKTSICQKLLSPARKAHGWKFSISYTTRSRRAGEQHGREYYFVDEPKFDAMVTEGKFAEQFHVHLYKYGTPRKPIDEIRRKGGVLVLDVDVKGAQTLKKEYPDAAAIFILPPSVASLRKRLRRRGTETDEQLRIRFENAKQEMRHFPDFGFDYIVINDKLQEAVAQVLAIVTAHRCRLASYSKEQLNRLTR